MYFAAIFLLGKTAAEDLLPCIFREFLYALLGLLPILRYLSVRYLNNIINYYTSAIIIINKWKEKHRVWEVKISRLFPVGVLRLEYGTRPCMINIVLAYDQLLHNGEKHYNLVVYISEWFLSEVLGWLSSIIGWWFSWLSNQWQWLHVACNVFSLTSYHQLPTVSMVVHITCICNRCHLLDNQWSERYLRIQGWEIEN